MDIPITTNKTGKDGYINLPQSFGAPTITVSTLDNKIK